MTKRFLCVFLSLVLCLSAFLGMPFSATAKADETPTENSVDLTDIQVNQDMVLAARFENMLNHNFIYGDDFYDDQTVIEGAILSLINFAEDGEINKALVLNFIANVYGLQVDENAVVYDFAPASEDTFTVLPRGYSAINHKILSVEENEGGFVVISKMSVNSHEGIAETHLVESIFVRNSGSCFGYNLLSANYIEAGNTL